MTANRVYCGTYTDLGKQGEPGITGDMPESAKPGVTGSDGIYIFDHDIESGALRHIHTVDGVVNPSFLALDPSERFLFAVNELYEFDGESTGAVSSFVIDRNTGVPHLVSQVPSGGANPCHLSVSPCGRYLLVANHGTATVAMVPIDERGCLSPLVDLRKDEPTDTMGHRQPHAHFVTPDPGGGFVLSTDTGTDRIMIYRLDAEQGRLIPNDPAWGGTHPGGSPRHLAFHPSGRFLYANGEADLTLSVFRYDAERGALEHVQHLSTLPEGVDTNGYSTAQIVVHPNGRFVYVSNRGHESITVFEIDEAARTATRIAVESTRGQTPRNFMIDPSGRFLHVANQDSNAIECFTIDPASGQLAHTDQAAHVPAPSCILFTTT
ncbi:MAG: 6-phosphogluconolactonase [uncultured Thermomicrobiales bacterium]|uniref:6-phosphogluconolactonase n=1 Tax=uncultured Thermomicrobiales bacterium TaxID=1645740 RepID=A0A6J4UBV7_9BACT|nr:MAG: 6-phosphogluconolactonase [uncultured Thermomicrobiales bacterium]